MKPPQIAVIAVAALVAFGAAFGIGKVTNKSEASPSAEGGVKSIEIAGAPAVGSVTTGGALPSLKAVKRKTTTKKPSTSSSSSSSGSTTQVQPTQQQTQVRQQTQTQTQTQTQPRQQTQTQPKPKPKPTSGGVSGGGED